MLAHHRETSGIRSVHLAQIHGQLDNVPVPVLHRLADPIVVADSHTGEDASAGPVPYVHGLPFDRSRPPPVDSKAVPVAAAPAAELWAAVAEAFLEELQAVVLLASRTVHVLPGLPWGSVWQSRPAHQWLETQCCS